MKLISENEIIYERKVKEKEEREDALVRQKLESQSSMGRSQSGPGGITYTAPVVTPFGIKGRMTFLIIFTLLAAMMAFAFFADKLNPKSTIAQHTTAEAAVALDVDQKRNAVTYKALKEALQALPIREKIWSADTLGIKIPTSGGDGFNAAWAGLFQQAAAEGKDTIGAASVVVTNQLSDMGVFMLIDIDHRHFHSVFIRPGATERYFYKGLQQADFNFYIGRGWNPGMFRALYLPKQWGFHAEKSLIKGGFEYVPPKQSEYLNPGYGAFARAGMEGRKPFCDTVTVTMSNEGAIELLLGLDERDF